ncbi:MAG: response regulator transcription factor [Anaerolineales bacterium]|nr:response regulator transcription factor [Anaerolineales bacterium]
MTEKILVANSDRKTQKTLTEILLKDGHDVTSVDNGQAALDILEAEEIDVGMVALDLPGVDGIEVLRRAGEFSPRTKIILIAEKGSTESMLAAIRHRAHDYFIEPFDPQEILSSITRALMQRRKEKHTRIFVEQIEKTLQQMKDELGYTDIPKTPLQTVSLPGNVSLDLARRELWSGSTRERLTPTESKLLEIFVKNWGRVLTHTNLVFMIQGYEVDALEAPEILRPLISRLRKKLGSFPSGGKWISSVRGIGYVFDPGAPK